MLAIAAWFGYSKWYLPRHSGPPSHQAFGFLKSMTANQLVISGVHIIDGQEVARDYNQRLQDLTVVLTPATKLVKSVWHMPVTSKALTDDKVKVDPAAIKKESLTGSISDFQNITGLPMTVTTLDNSVDKTTLQASEIDYTTYVFAQ